MAQNAISALGHMPWWYWVLALLFSMYHAYRGYIVQRAHTKDEEVDAGENWHWSSKEAFFVRYLYDAFLYFVCSLSGFLSLGLALHVFRGLPNLNDISGGTSAALVFLVLIGLLGITGILPYVIQRGSFPK